MRGAVGFFTSEMVALVSAICIVGIFFVAHHQRQVSSYDQAAYRLAQKVQENATQACSLEESACHPEARAPVAGKVTAANLAKLGVAAKPPLHLKVEHDVGLNPWQVKVWHDEGLKVYTITPGKLTESYR